MSSGGLWESINVGTESKGGKLAELAETLAESEAQIHDSTLNHDLGSCCREAILPRDQEWISSPSCSAVVSEFKTYARKYADLEKEKKEKKGE